MIQITPKRSSQMRSFVTIVGLVCAVVIFSTEIGSKWLAGISFVSAAVVVALQSFVASFFAYLYIRITNMFEVGDIIKTNISSTIVSGQVTHLGIFFISIKEIDADMMFTGTAIECPNNVIFGGGLFNHTKKNYLFWSESKFCISPQHPIARQDFEQFCSIVTQAYEETLTDPIYTHSPESNVFQTKPKYELSITDKGLQCKVRILVHFHKLIHTNNSIHCALIDAHSAGKIALAQLRTGE